MKPGSIQGRTPLTVQAWFNRLSFLVGLLGLAWVYGALNGVEHYTFNDIHNLIKGSLEDTSKVMIFWQVRIPRVWAAAIVGGALGISGAVLQTLLRNPLAEPYLLGISSGAAVGAYAALLLGFQVTFLGLTTISAFALCGGLAAVWIVYTAAKKQGRLPAVTLILAGVVVNAMLGAVILFAASVLEAGRVMSVTIWLLGHIETLDWVPLLAVSAYVIVGSLVLMGHARSLNALVLGEESARSLGIPVESLKRRMLLLSAFLTAVAVSISGLIGFVGMIIPHAVRFIWGPDHRLLLPASFLLGAAVLILADTLARIALQPAELPVGIITAIIGGPVFLILLKLRKDYA